MSDPQTYAELQAAVLDWLNRDDMDTRVASFISLAERRFNRVLRVPEMETDVTATVTEAVVTLPTDFLEMRSVYVNGEDDVASDYPLQQIPIDQLRDTYGGSLAGYSTHYAIQNSTEMVLAPAPEEETVLVMNYFQKIPALSDSNTTNWLLTAHPDLYLAQALFEGFTFTRDPEQMQTWATRASVAMDEMKRQAMRKSFSAGPLRMRIRGMPTGAISRL